MTLSPEGALRMAGTLYATCSTSSHVVHLSEPCIRSYTEKGIRDYAADGGQRPYKSIEHPGAIPLSAEVCSFCDPTTPEVRR